jgi:hypothetical protein
MGIISSGSYPPSADIFTSQTSTLLFERGLLQAKFQKISLESVKEKKSAKWMDFCKYELTPFGRAVISYVLQDMDYPNYLHQLELAGIQQAEIDKYLESLNPPKGRSPEESH